MRLVSRHDHTELLRRPVGRWMRRDVPVHDSSRAHFQHHEHVQNAERSGDGNEEVTCQNGPRMIPNERAPRLRAARRAWCRPRRHVAPYRPRRQPDADFHEELRGNPLLAPRHICCRHLSDQLAQIRRDSRSARRLRLPTPKKSEPFSMPSDQRLWLDDDQELTPVQQSGQRDERDSRCVVGPAWVEQVLGGQVLARLQCQPRESSEISENLQHRSNIEATPRRVHASERTRSVVNRPRVRDSVHGKHRPEFGPDQHFCGPHRREPREHDRQRSQRPQKSKTHRKTRFFDRTSLRREN
jgi:hypothetical protein